MDILKKKFFNIKGLAIYIAIFAIVLTLGTSYAYFIYNKDGNSHELIAGNVYLNSTDKGSVSLTGLYPMSDEDGIENGIKYTFDVTGYNLSNKDIHYGVYVNYGEEKENKTRFRDADIKFYLTETINGVTSRVYGPSSVKDFNRSILYANTIEGNISKDTPINISYELTMWISDNVLISDSVTELEGRSIYTTDEFKNSYASIKVEVYGDFVEKNLPVIGYITYDTSSLGIANPKSTPIYSNLTGTVTNEVTSTTLNNFIGWSTSLNGEVVYLPGDSINASDIVNNNLTLYPVLQKEKLVDKITSTLTLTDASTDIDGTRYVTGTNPNNYLWYSGKLWRIVSINGDGSIKLVTQNNITTLTWDILESNTDYSTSQIRTWLNDEFLPTLYDADNLLVDSTWDYTTYEEETATKVTPTSTVTNEKVGLLTIYEASSLSFLENEYSSWLMSPQTDSLYVWLFNFAGTEVSSSPTTSMGVRPSVNLKSNIQLLGGIGKKDDPYLIVGDKENGKNSEFLSNRVSGEYINFNNTLYRIVGTEKIDGQTLTKITMADYSQNNNTLTNSLTFGASTSAATYSPSYGIGLYLEEWYNADSTSETYADTYINNSYKKLIATAQDDKILWYTGSASSSYDYTLSKIGTSVSATIGLGYYGEIFSSPIEVGNLSNPFLERIWLMTKYSSSNVWYVNVYGTASNDSPTSTYGVRPSFYLKSHVKIVSGSGLPHNPYEIKSGAPSCSFSQSPNLYTGGEIGEFYLACTSDSGFKDSDINISDFEFDNSKISITNIAKSSIDNGYRYTITVKSGSSVGAPNITIKKNSIISGDNCPNERLGTSIVVINKDITKPVCTFYGPTNGTISKDGSPNTSEFSLECTDNMGLSNDSKILASDFEFSTNGVVQISNIVSSKITGGYKYTITVTAVNDGTTTLTLKSGVYSDGTNNTNDSVTSNSITVASIITDVEGPSCVFTGPDDATIYMMTTPNSTNFYLTCTDESEFGDSDITTSDFSIGTSTYSLGRAAPGGSSEIVSDPPIYISSVTKNAITGGYKYTITVRASLIGDTTISLKPGVISDKYGNGNVSVTSESIAVRRQ